MKVDPADGRDRALLRRAAKERWPIDESNRAKYLAALHRALDAAETPRDIASIVKTAATLDGLNVKWHELEDKLERLDGGTATEIHELRIIFDNEAPVHGQAEADEKEADDGEGGEEAQPDRADGLDGQEQGDQAQV